jgi:hypothetical protein
MSTRKDIDTAETTTQTKDISSDARGEVLKRVEKDYEEFKKRIPSNFRLGFMGHRRVSW